MAQDAREQIVYSFIFPDDRVHKFSVELCKATGRLVSTSERNHDQSWTALKFNQCPHCPLNESTSPQCPIAKNLDTLAHEFRNEKSHSIVKVEVETNERTYSKTLPLQEGLFGLIGLIMATSDCPYFAFLRPMARFHLPFSSLDETLVRSASFYLFKQYFNSQRGLSADFELKEFTKLYSNIHTVNQSIISRIRSISKADAETNSLVILDVCASLLSAQTKRRFDDLESLFT